MHIFLAFNPIYQIFSFTWERFVNRCYLFILDELSRELEEAQTALATYKVSQFDVSYIPLPKSTSICETGCADHELCLNQIISALKLDEIIVKKAVFLFYMAILDLRTFCFNFHLALALTLYGLALMSLHFIRHVKVERRKRFRNMHYLGQSHQGNFQFPIFSSLQTIENWGVRFFHSSQISTNHTQSI